MARRTVAVVGGGCAGVLATRELLGGTADDVVLIEPDRPGGGLAYGSARPWHLLNSRAGAMSADPADPGHFARWAGCAPEEFRPRQEYGRYLESVFRRRRGGATRPVADRPDAPRRPVGDHGGAGDPQPGRGPQRRPAPGRGRAGGLSRPPVAGRPHGGRPGPSSMARGRSAGNLAACPPRAAAPAQP